ncbi:MAG: fibronectin type III domain-containing protein, partial [Clostridia bacterium]|nr:fibronectin type III domain-containing protein [Clostridia bacterium]
MRGYQGWSYRPYRPPMTDVGDIYICRVVPSETAIHVEWLESNATDYTVYWRRRGDETFNLAGTTADCAYDIVGLQPDTDYEFYVSAAEKRSRIRLARCGKSVGTVVNYLHPEDDCYAFSGRYLCSPSLLQHPDGYLLASMDVFAPNHPQNLTLIFRSDDGGENWHYVNELMPCFWGKLFLHGGDVYML